MKILIVGAGVVGFHLAHELSTGQHDITLIDQNADLIAQAASKLDAITIHGDGTRPSVLKKAGIERAEMVVAVTSSDEVNLVISHLALKFGVPKKVARIRKEEWFQEGLFSTSEFGIDRIINPDRLIVNYVQKIMATPGLIDVAEFSDPGVSLLGFRVLPDMPILGKKLAELRAAFSLDAFLIATIYRDGRMFIPTGEDVILKGDTCYVLTNTEMTPFVLPIFNKNLEPVHSVVISGGNRTGLQIAQNIESSFPDLVLVEPDKGVAETVAEALTETRVIHGDPMERDLLRELNIGSVDCFISVAREAKSNLLTGLLAKQQGAKRVIIITDETEYLPVMDAIGLDVVINPRLIIAGEILRYIRRGRIHSVVKLKTGGVEMIELDIPPTSKAVGKPLSKLKFPAGAIIGAIVEDGNLFFPTGETVLKPGQKIVLITRSEVVEKAEHFFR